MSALVNISKEGKFTSRDIARLTGTPHSDTLKKIRKILKKVDSDFRQLNFRECYYVCKSNQQRPMFHMTEEGYNLILSKYNIITPNEINCWKAKDEYVFGQEIVEKLFSGYEIISQFQLFGGSVRLDWYIPELKLAIEFDEEQHFIGGELKKECIERQQRVERELGCRFLRYKK